MKKLILYAILLVFSFGLNAQVEINPDSISANGPVDSEGIEVLFDVTNAGGSDVSLWWQLVKTDFPKDWTSQVCDANNCYVENFDACPTGLPNNIMVDSTKQFSIKFKPHGFEGTSLMYFKIYSDSDNTVEVASLPVLITAGSTSAGSISLQKELAIYPNPCVDKFMLNNPNGLEKVEVYNIAGKKMKSFSVVAGKEYAVDDLTNGLYIVRFLDQKDKVVDVLRLSKR
jgi:hypothetical protein